MALRIIQLIQKVELRGAQIFACQLGNHLQDLGHTVRMLCLFDGLEQLPFRGEIHNLKLSLNKRFFDLAGWKQLAKEVQEFDTAVIQANAGDTLKYAVLSKLFFRWKAPIVFRNASVMSQYIKRPWVKWWNAFLFQFVAQVVSVSEASKQDFIGLFPFMKDKVTVIGIGLECVPLPLPRQHAASYVLHVGGFTFEKNHARLLHIFHQVQRLNPGLELWLVGDGPLRQMIEAQAVSMNLNGVCFLGYRNDVLSIMMGAELLILPSVIEGLPGVILEAMYCKTPVVAYNVGGISEVIKNNETGWLLKAGDEVGFVKAVDEVLNTDVTAICIKANELVVREFDNRVVAERFAEVYRLVVSS